MSDPGMLLSCQDFKGEPQSREPEEYSRNRMGTYARVLIVES